MYIQKYVYIYKYVFVCVYVYFYIALIFDIVETLTDCKGYSNNNDVFWCKPTLAAKGRGLFTLLLFLLQTQDLLALLPVSTCRLR